MTDVVTTNPRAKGEQESKKHCEHGERTLKTSMMQTHQAILFHEIPVDDHEVTVMAVFKFTGLCLQTILDCGHNFGHYSTKHYKKHKVNKKW